MDKSTSIYFLSVADPTLVLFRTRCNREFRDDLDIAILKHTNHCNEEIRFKLLLCKTRHFFNPLCIDAHLAKDMSFPATLCDGDRACEREHTHAILNSAERKQKYADRYGFFRKN